MVEGEGRVMSSSSVVVERKEERGEQEEVVMSGKCGGGLSRFFGYLFALPTAQHYLRTYRN